MQGWGIAVVILTTLATLYLSVANLLIPMLAYTMASDASTRQDAYTLVDLELGVGNINALWVLVPLMVWMWRVAKNTEAFPQSDDRLKPSWAIWGWIVPGLNVSYPLRMMLQLTKEEREGDAWSNLARVWWLTVVSSVAITLGEAFDLLAAPRPGSLTAPSDQHLAYFSSRVLTGVVTGVLIVIAGVMLSALVLAIGKAQTDRINARAARAAAAAAFHAMPAQAPAQPSAVAV